MVITVRGTDSNENKAAHMTACLSATGAAKKSRKTLVMQICRKANIEDLLIGKRNAEVDIHDIGFIYEDTGMDALMMRIGSVRVQKEHFDACTSSVMEDENMLDIAGPSKRDNFEQLLIEDEEKFTLLLDQAKDVYDDIYIYASGSNEKLMEMLNKHSDVSIICIRQGTKEVVKAAHPNSIYLITNYDRDSLYSIRSLRKEYKVEKMYGMPYNCEFKDAYNDGNILGFLAKNEKISESDINYLLIDSINNILNLFLDDKEEEAEEELPESFEDTEEVAEELTEYSEPSVKIVEKKKGFGKKEKAVVEADPDIEYLDEDDEDDFVSKLGEHSPSDEDDYDENDFIPAPAIPDPEPVKQSRRDKKSKKMRKRGAIEQAKSILEETEDWTCPGCGEINPSKAKFCMECGTTKPVIPKEWTCPNCGEVNPPKAKFCMECGSTK